MLMSKYTLFTSLFTFIVLLSGCGSDSTSDSDTQTTSQESSFMGKAQLGNIANADVNIYKIAQDGSKTLQWHETTSTGTTLDAIGNFSLHSDELEADTFYLYEVIGGEDWDLNDDGVLDQNATPVLGKIRAIAKTEDILAVNTNFKVSLASEILFEIVEKSLLNDFNATQFQDNIDTNASYIVNDIDNNGKINNQDILVYTVPSYKPMLKTSYIDQLPTLLSNLHQGVLALPNLTIITSENLTLNENETTVATLQGQDLNGDPLQWSISGGVDQDFFTIDATSGVLSFKQAPDFEQPLDSDNNNNYSVMITVTDGSYSDTKTFSIIVQNTNDTAPTFEIPTNLSISEAHTNIIELKGTDLDGDPVTYAISGGDDSDKFIIIDNTLSFIDAPNFNAPLDSNGDNIYDVSLSISDTLHTTTQTFHITVTNIIYENFIISVKTDNPGVTSDTQFLIPTNADEDYNYSVDCDNDGVYEIENTDTNYTCSYASSGTYQIVIRDNTNDYSGFPRIYFNGEGDNEKLVGINQWGAERWVSMRSAFNGCINLSNINGDAIDTPNLSLTDNLSYMFKDAKLFNQNISNWDTSNITDMYGLFYGAETFNQDISQWDTSHVENMAVMFKDTIAFNQNISNWNTSSVTNMDGMFDNAQGFNQNISQWDTSHVENMANMFKSALIYNQPLNGWDTTNVTDMNSMFYGATIFNQPLNDWNTTNVTNMGSMFKYATEFNQDISQWSTSKVTDFSSMFYGATAFDQPISQWDTSSAQTMASMFKYAEHFTQYLNTWNTSNVTDMSSMFYSAAAFDRSIGNWDTSNVTNMYAMFKDAYHFNQDINQWDVHNVTNFSYMFYNAAGFDQDLNNWDTGNVTDMSYMFKNAVRFNGNIATWNISHVTTLNSMFYNAPIFNQDIRNWNTSSVTDMNYLFKDASAFNQYIGDWDTSNVETMDSLFYNDYYFNQDISHWNTSKVTNMRAMFKGLTNFNYDIGSWDTSHVTTMEDMFYNAENFNQDIGNWNTDNVESMKGMFKGAAAFNQYIRYWNTENVTDMSGMFYDAEAFDQNIENWNTSNVTNMSTMFYGASNFNNHDLSQWDVHNVTDHTDFLTNAGEGNIEPNWP